MTDNFQKLLDELKQNHSSTENLVKGLKTLIDDSDKWMRKNEFKNLDRALAVYMDLALAPSNKGSSRARL